MAKKTKEEPKPPQEKQEAEATQNNERNTFQSGGVDQQRIDPDERSKALRSKEA